MDTRHITWENFEDSFIKPGDPAVHPVPGNPKVTFFVDDQARRIGLHIFHKEPLSVDPSIHEQIDLHVFMDSHYHVLEVSVSDRDLYEAFYAVMIKVADQVQLHKIAGIDAINNAIADFQRLIQKRGLMSDDKIVGLWGELWFYRSLDKLYGIKVLDSWKGPERAVHDFRFGEYEFEIKTTRKEERRHIISRLSQMEESPDRQLYLVSIQVIP
ncbi:MAG: PD-(D/E)XK motif protein, partial [Candidatus Pacearchaeota archaeon]|nr:PD-(D/E)XK motif protein [Candidatus Pacearchaeota archaeon]